MPIMKIGYAIALTLIKPEANSEAKAPVNVPCTSNNEFETTTAVVTQ